jgi:DNA-binding HxlR family transcriptional regulator
MRKKPKRLAKFKRSACPVANMLDVLGDKWTLLIVRDLFLGKRLYREFVESPEGIPTNILAERLKRLEAAGIVVREPYQDRPVRYAYALTKKGKDLFPVVAEIIRWANKHIAGTVSPPRDLVERFLQMRPDLRG